MRIFLFSFVYGGLVSNVLGEKKPGISENLFPYTLPQVEKSFMKEIIS
jgi:hypothetical protein